MEDIWQYYKLILLLVKSTYFILFQSIIVNDQCLTSKQTKPVI